MNKTSNSIVFDRMAKAQTFARMARKMNAPPRSQLSLSRSVARDVVTLRLHSSLEQTSSRNSSSSSSNGSMKVTNKKKNKSKRYEPTPTPPVFHKLAEVETVAFLRLKGKEVPTYVKMKSSSCSTSSSSSSSSGKKTTTSSFFDRISKTETVSSKQRKLAKVEHAKLLAMDRASGVGILVESGTKRNAKIHKPMPVPPVFHKLAKMETVASLTLKGKEAPSSIKMPSSTCSTSSLSSASSGTNGMKHGKQTTTSFFDRMSKTETVSSKQRKLANVEHAKLLAEDRAYGIRLPIPYY